MRLLFTLLFCFLFFTGMVYTPSRAVTFSFTNAAVDEIFGSMLTDGQNGIPDVPGVTYQVFYADHSGTSNDNLAFYSFDNESFYDGHTGYFNPKGPNDSYEAVIQTTDGSEFNFKSIYLFNPYGYSATGYTVRIVGYRDGVMTGSVTVNADNPQYGLSVNQSNGLSPEDFQNVDRVEIQPGPDAFYNEFLYTFNDIVLDDPITSLPVNLLSFTATPSNTGMVMLKWETATETNNDHFTVERSADGKTFTSIGNVNGKNNSLIAQSYQFIDNKPLNGENYYRLQQTDIDGRTRYLKTKMAKVNEENTVVLEKNPVNNEVVIHYRNADKAKIFVQLLSAGGQILNAETISLQTGDNRISLPVQGLSTGIYFVKITGDSENRTIRFIKK